MKESGKAIETIKREYVDKYKLINKTARGGSGVRKHINNPDYQNQPWVILIKPTATYKQFHIEPKRKFENTPSYDWELFREFENYNDAFDWFDTDEAKQFSKERQEHTRTIRQKETGKKSKVDRSVRIKVFERDNYRCQICGRGAQDGVTLEVDHIIPRAKGGSNNINNLQVLCFDCNRGKRDKVLPNLINSNTI